MTAIGYVIYYLDEASFKENSKPKWKSEQVAIQASASASASASDSSAHLTSQQHVIGKLMLETVYYFKIQSRNNKAYGASSPTIIFKTPNCLSLFSSPF